MTITNNALTEKSDPNSKIIDLDFRFIVCVVIHLTRLHDLDCMIIKFYNLELL